MPSSPSVGRVSRLWRYPVKSLRGEQVDKLELDPRGALGDRLFAVRTQAGKLGSGKNTRRFELVDGLLHLAASIGDDGIVVIHLTDTRAVRGDDPEVNAVLTEVLGRPVTLAREAEIPHHDAAPIHIVSESTIEWLRQRTSGVATDERRLRPNIVLDTEDAPLAEEAWIGRELELGAVRLRVRARTQRCVMVGFAQGELPEAPTALRSIAQENDSYLGIYADVITPGVIAVGAVVG